MNCGQKVWPIGKNGLPLLSVIVIKVKKKGFRPTPSRSSFGFFYLMA